MMIVLDQQRLCQILLNLVSNAIKFTPSGGKVTITCKRIREVEDLSVLDQSFLQLLSKQENQYIEFQVEDTGIGIK